MKAKQTEKQKAKLGNAFKDVKVKAGVSKSAVIIIRATDGDKADMQATAQRLGVSLTEYLTRLHELARPNLK